MSMQDQLPPSEEPVSKPAPSPSFYDTSAPIAAGPNANDKNMGMLVHVLAIFFPLLGPLLIWLTQKETSPWASDEAKAALNFHITAFFASIAVGILAIITFGLGLFLYFPLGIAVFVFEVLGAIEASKGNHYKYPFSLNLIN